MWKSPGQICDALRGDNITYDALTALKEKYKEKVKILFDCSVRDVALAQTQVYFDRGELPDQVSKSEADRFQQALKTMAQDLRREIPDCGVYIWEKEVTGEAKTTPHTITGVNLVFDQMDGQEKTIAQWIWEGVNGNIQSYGMPLLEKKY